MTVNVTSPTAAGVHDPTAAPLFQSPLPIIGVTGEYSSGKTLFGLTIAPGAATRVYDSEKSAETYRALGFDRVDVPAEMQRLRPKGYKPVDTFSWWWDHVRTIQPGRFRVICLDVANDIETGAVDWVRQNPGYFSRTAAQYVKMSGLLWGDMKELWKTVLADLASRCETFVFAVHMGDVWAGDKPSGKRKPRGKSTLMELASLYLQMERPKDAKGNVQAVPSAVVLKSRLAHTTFDPQTGAVRIVPALPPRLPVATPAAIRQYLASPPDYDKLSKDERAPDAGLSDDDRAAIRLATAEAEAEAARFALEKVERQERAAAAALEKREAAVGARRPTTEPRPVPEAKPAANGQHTATQQPAAGPAPSSPVTSPPANWTPRPGQITYPQMQELGALRSEVFGLLGINGDQAKCKAAWEQILAKRHVTSAKDLTEQEAAALIESLKKRAEAEHAKRRESAAEGGGEQLADKF